MQSPRETMDSRVFSQSDLLQLLDEYEAPYVSLFMPMHATNPDRQQDAIRLRNLVRDAEQQLRKRGASGEHIRQLLGQIEAIPGETESWEHRSQALAVFCTTDFFRCFNLPLDLDECAVVDDHFHISPLIPMLHANGRFFILALTKDSADLYEATRFSLVARELPTTSPVKIDDDERPLQYHSHQAPSAAKGRAKEAIFHGQGGPGDREKDDVLNFFKRQVEPGVSFALRDQRAPLVLACVESLVPLYTSANTYPHLCADYACASPSELSEDQLHRRAWKMVAPSFRAAEQQARSKYEALAGSERTQAVTDPILAAARRGRVDTLFLPARSEYHESDAMLIEEAAEQTLLFGGQVLAVDEVPGDASLAAVLRY